MHFLKYFLTELHSLMLFKPVLGCAKLRRIHRSAKVALFFGKFGLFFFRENSWVDLTKVNIYTKNLEIASLYSKIFNL